MKRILCSLLFLIFTRLVYAQGWIYTDSSTIYPVNNSLNLGPIAVGIGTDKPSSQFHTTGSVRFQGLTEKTGQERMVVADINGVLYYDKIPTGGGGNGSGWALNGNSVNNDNFLGTTNGQGLRIRTNNLQRAVISNNGYVGINESNPSSFLHVNGTLLVRSNESIGNYFYPNAPQIKIESDPSKNTEAGKSHGALLTLSNRNTTSSWDIIQGRTCGAKNNDLNFFYYSNSNVACYSINPTLTLEKNNVGVNMNRDQMPVANLHTRGTVRFQDLPWGTGNFVVINDFGDITRSERYPAFQDDVNALKAELEKTKKELAELKQVLFTLAQKVEQSNK